MILNHNIVRKNSSVLDAIVDLWVLCGCSHPPYSAESSLFTLTLFSPKSLPKYLHKILLLLPDTLLIIAIFSKGWCCLPQLQDTVESKDALKCHPDMTFSHLLLSVTGKFQFLCGTTYSYLGQRTANSPSYKMYLWNPNNNNAL